MTFVRYQLDESVISSEKVTRNIWENGSILDTFFLDGTQSVESQKYYLDVFDTPVLDKIQFSIQYGHKEGLGSTLINTDVPGLTPSLSVYNQYKNLLYGGAPIIIDIDEVEHFWVINIARRYYKESLKPGSLTLKLSNGSLLSLTDDSKVVTESRFINGSKYFNIVPGEMGVTTGTTIYGRIFPDLGIILLDAGAIPSSAIAAAGVQEDTDEQNNLKLFNSISSGSYFRLNSQETISSRYFYTRLKNNAFNYSTNPSLVDNQGNIIFPELIDNPQTFVTTIGLYNDNNELLAVAKLSKCLVKDFTKEQLIRVKLDY